MDHLGTLGGTNVALRKRTRKPLSISLSTRKRGRQSNATMEHITLEPKAIPHVYLPKINTTFPHPITEWQEKIDSPKRNVMVDDSTDDYVHRRLKKLRSYS